MITRLIGLIKHNLPIKILALIFATALWFFVMNDQNPAIDSTYEIPITVLNEPQNYMITKSADTVKLKVHGSRSLFVNLSENDFKANVDLSKVQDGTSKLKIQFQIPSGLDFVEAEPDTLSVTLDPYIDITKNAELIVTGSTSPDTTLARMNQSVESVKVQGPKSAVESVTRVIGYVGLSGNDKDFSLDIPLTAINEDGREVPMVRVVPSSIRADVQLARGLSKKVVNVTPKVSGSAASGYTIVKVRVDPVKIEVAGDSQVINAINDINTMPIIVDGKTDSFSEDVKLNLPAGVTVTNSSVNVNVDIKKEENNNDGVNND